MQSVFIIKQRTPFICRGTKAGILPQLPRNIVYKHGPSYKHHTRFPMQHFCCCTTTACFDKLAKNFVPSPQYHYTFSPLSLFIASYMLTHLTCLLATTKTCTAFCDSLKMGGRIVNIIKKRAPSAIAKSHNRKIKMTKSYALLCRKVHTYIKEKGQETD